MQTGLYVGVSSQIALEKRMNTLADNVANSTTVGFRATEVKFNTVLGDTKPNKVAFVGEGAEFLNTKTGGLSHTGNSLDVAVKGDAWLSIETPAGPALTRDGRFSLTETGDLVTLRGYPVLDAGGAPIQLNANAGELVIGKDGAIRQNGTQVAALGLYEANFARGFNRYDNSAILPNAAPDPIVDRMDVGVMQGYVEESNVNPVQEMSQLITVSRAFESIASLLRDSETSLDEAIKTLGGSK
ncbi:flagellar biosynthesis protein FlgF [Rhizobium sp. Leaf384]|uniref:flagellar basal-body rod protein FlgF n=1 Tax=unclassified Rhizobium TaxID=2613769 RepID=UPI0007153ED8|nr:MULTISPECIES: flagellar basal-body rod protein FlgF [unclassified Rhizobium]KQR77751.1 flagellar biosynthesis protein FlgF [Rhizobium sp. Leaf341]KQS80969.1 flagellar biosynthesis protein FlgF [Rhizobium sp. Leaf384]KQS86830.1 flagellar biosynthesis protein FlgF [Rhizobium sp. Leaf383]